MSDFAASALPGAASFNMAASSFNEVCILGSPPLNRGRLPRRQPSRCNDGVNVIFAGEANEFRTVDENTSADKPGFQPAISDEVPDRPRGDTAQHNAGLFDIE